jgi:iron(III) transport system substrate-binding protein
MMNSLYVRIASFVLMVMLSACGVQSTSGVNEQVTNNGEVVEKRTLVVYSGRSETLIKPIIDAYMSTHPAVNVLLKAGKDNELAATILEEKNAPQADVYITTNFLTSLALARDGVFVPHTVPNAAEIPAQYISPEAMWTPITLRARVLMYNTDQLTAEQAPTSIQALTDPKWAGRVAAANSTNGAMQAHIATLITRTSRTEVETLLTGLVQNNVTFFGGHTDVRKAVGSGEFAVGLVNHYYYELQKREPTDNKVGVVYPDQAEGEMGLVLNATAASVVKGGPNTTDAQNFVDFLLQPDTQKLFAELNFEYPIIPSVPLAEGVTPLTGLKIAAFSIADMEAQVPAAQSLMAGAGIP